MRTKDTHFTPVKMSKRERDCALSLLQTFSEQKPNECFYTDLALKKQNLSQFLRSIFNPSAAPGSAVTYLVKGQSTKSQYDLESFYLIMSDEHPAFNRFLDKSPAL